ncbi:TFB1M [Cordylochernes scorpioides]|uniref:rRNA adenine N(6)-methyltransferase n=1 Tax=Cordylochernes scorpioides TaxID=51811 RepID=A0ABY6L4Y6_9ARAC|nr:TFB1M [Cordylochernes scorpioides]
MAFCHQFILGQARREVIAIEKDRHFIPTLEMLVEAAPGVMKFALGDILRFDLGQILPMDQAKDWDDICTPVTIIGNLPFNVASPLLIKWLREISERSRAFALGRVPLMLTFQKEVAERIVAPPLWDERSRLSIMSQIYCHSQVKLTISGKCFSPRPQVDVSIRATLSMFFLLPWNREFQGKRKNMLSVLKNLFPPSHDFLLPELLHILRMDLSLKPILLSVEDIGRICYGYRHLCEAYPDILQYNYEQPQLFLTAPIDPQLFLPVHS